MDIFGAAKNKAKLDAAAVPTPDYEKSGQDAVCITDPFERMVSQAKARAMSRTYAA